MNGRKERKKGKKGKGERKVRKERKRRNGTIKKERNGRKERREGTKKAHLWSHFPESRIEAPLLQQE